MSLPAGGCAFPTLRPGERTLLAVDARAAGPGKVTCSVLSPDGAEVDVDVAENPDGTFHVSYTAPEPGSYGLTVRFGGQHVPNSPFRIVVCGGGRLGSEVTGSSGVMGSLGGGGLMGPWGAEEHWGSWEVMG